MATTTTACAEARAPGYQRLDSVVVYLPITLPSPAPPERRARVCRSQMEVASVLGQPVPP